MNPILTAVLILAAIALVCGLMLVIASKFMAVPVDEKFAVIRECLPGANCGGCGYPGCDGYAQALADGSEEKINKCSAGGNSVAEALATACGKAFEESVKMTAYVHCRGTCDVTQKKEEFQGTKSCKAVRLLFGGDGACQFGCLGYGDCAAVCPEEAIRIVNGVALVNPARCIACQQCVITCPQKIISIIPESATVRVGCSNKDKGVTAKKKCTAACIGCGLCNRKCPTGAITVTNNLASIDQSLCTGCGACQEVCPQKCIV